LALSLARAYTATMSAVYRPSTKWRSLYGFAAVLSLAVTFSGQPGWALVGLAGFAFSMHRAVLHGQQIVLTRTGVICRSPFGERRLAYRQIGRMRCAWLTGDLVLERPLVSVRIPASFTGGDEIRRAVSLAVWAHRGGDVPPDLAEADSAFL
jgi:hypothetical protein